MGDRLRREFDHLRDIIFQRFYNQLNFDLLSVLGHSTKLHFTTPRSQYVANHPLPCLFDFTLTQCVSCPSGCVMVGSALWNSYNVSRSLHRFRVLLIVCPPAPLSRHLLLDR